MSTLSVRLPDSLHKHLKAAARQEGISVNQLVNRAITEKLSTLDTRDYLEQRAQRANREAFEEVLAKVPDVEPEAFDRLSEAE